MPRGMYVRKGKENGKDTAAVAEVSIASIVAKAPWFKEKLSAQEQSNITFETHSLAASLLKYGNAKLEIGQHLTKLQGMLEPHSLFTKYLRLFHFSKKTAYRYVNGFKNAQATLPAPVLKAALVRNVDIIGYDADKPLGKYTEAIKALPPPATLSEAQAETYLDQLEDVRKKTKQEPTEEFIPTSDPNVLVKEMFRFDSIRLRRISNAKQKQAAIHKLFGMLINDVGIANPVTIAPQAIPEDYRTVRGGFKKPVQSIAAA